MECYYHPERDGTDQCAICGKSICKECGLEIAGKTYCKECLEKIVGVGIEKEAKETQPVAAEKPAKAVDEEIYQPPKEVANDIPSAQQASYEVQGINDDSPYNVRDNAEPEITYQKPEQDTLKQQPADDDFIYPDHSYQPEVTSARQDLEDKYEKYLDDLYFDENDVPLNEQLAKDEAQYGSLTRKPYEPKEEPVTQKPSEQRKDPMNETPEEMEARIRAEILAEQKLMSDQIDTKEKKGKLKRRHKDDGDQKENIHNLKYQDEKEPMGVVDILLTIILIIIILVVVYYIIYILFLNMAYPTFMDAIYALSNPQNVINNILSAS